MLAPRYLRFARALALLTGAASTACGAVVSPANDAASADVVDAAPETAVPPEAGACPATAPTPGTACAAPQRCSYEVDAFCSRTCGCEAAPNGTAQWSCGMVCEGPLPPPDLAA